MPRATPKPKGNGTPASPADAEVLTLAEAAAYLRVAEEEVVRLVATPGFPGRLVGGEWRFLKAALQDWLRTPPPPSSREALVALAGSGKDDPTLDELREEISRKRGRSLTEARK